MARRIASHGEYLPQLPDGLVAHWSRFWDHIPSMGLNALNALAAGESIGLDGALVWDALQLVNPAAADAFRRRLGWRPGASGSWHAVDESRWTYNPRTSTLSPVPKGSTG